VVQAGAVWQVAEQQNRKGAEKRWTYDECIPGRTSGAQVHNAGVVTSKRKTRESGAQKRCVNAANPAAGAVNVRQIWCMVVLW